MFCIQRIRAPGYVEVLTGRILCRLGFHSWRMAGRVVFGSGIAVGPCVCARCGFRKIRRI